MHIQDIEPEPEQDQLAVVVASSPLEKTKAEKLKEMFVPFLDNMHSIESRIKAIDAVKPTNTDIKIAKEIRIALKNNRIKAEEKKDELKASILIEGRVIDGFFAVINNTSKSIELSLSNIEKAAEIAEANRKKELASNRAEQLSMYEIDLTGYALGAMADNTFAMLLENTKAGHEKRLEDKRKEEGLRVQKEANERLHKARLSMLHNVWQFVDADMRNSDLSTYSNDEWTNILADYDKLLSDYTAEQLRIKEENERLKKEAEEKEAQQRAERERIAEEARINHQRINARNELQAIRLNAVKPYLSFIDTDLNALADMEEITFDALLDNGKRLFEIDEKQKADAKQKLEDAEKERQRVAKELQAKQDAIEKQQREIAAAAKKAEQAPDKEKLQGLANDLRNYALPVVKSTEAAAIVKAAHDLLVKTADYIQNKINEL